jgi:hypothetical protein
MTNEPLRRRAHAIVPRSLLAYASIGIGMGVIPVSVSTISVGCGPPSPGVEPAIVDVDTGADASTSDVSIGIDPAMRVEASTDDDAGTDSGDPGDSGADAVVDP